jgi:hypothetical protein
MGSNTHTSLMSSSVSLTWARLQLKVRAHDVRLTAERPAPISAKGGYIAANRGERDVHG